MDNIFVPFVTVDAVTPLMKAKQAGADWCIGQWIYQTVPPYLNANHKLNLGLKFAVNTFGGRRCDDLQFDPTGSRHRAHGDHQLAPFLGGHGRPEDHPGNLGEKEPQA